MISALRRAPRRRPGPALELGQALGLPLTMTAIAFVGVAVTSATIIIFGRPIPNPVELVTQLERLPAVLFATLVIVIAQVTMNMSANVVSPSNDFSNLNPGLISYFYTYAWFVTLTLGFVLYYALMRGYGSDARTSARKAKRIAA